MMSPDNDMHERSEARVGARDRSEPTVASSTSSSANVLSGRITTIHQGLLNVGIRMSVGERTDLRVRWPLGSDVMPELVPGLTVNAVIPAEAVHLESGYFRLGKQRWNRWIGRIVRVEPLAETPMVEVKFHHDPVTLKCRGSMTGQNWTPQVWETVNIVVDPTKIRLNVGARHDGLQDRSLVKETLDSCQDVRVWLKAQIIETGEAPEGRLLSLLVGVARVSVLVGRDEDRFTRWRPGMTIEIHIGRYEAWVKPCGSDCPPTLCGLLYLDHQSLASAR